MVLIDCINPQWVELNNNDKLGITLNFDTLKLNYTLTYKPHRVRDLPVRLPIPNNILLKANLTDNDGYGYTLK